MSQHGRIVPSHIRNPSIAGTSTISTTRSHSLLSVRVAEKKAELTNLHELRDLSAQLADQMSQLEAKLATLSNGTEAVAIILSNWHSVLRAIQMASTKIPVSGNNGGELVDRDISTAGESGARIPQTLVRIPVQDGAAEAS